MPVPRALAAASLAAQRLAKKLAVMGCGARASSSAFNIALSPPVGVAVKAGRSIQLLATVTFVGKEGSMPSMRAVVPIQVRGGKKLQQRHIATLWVSIATVRN